MQWTYGNHGGSAPAAIAHTLLHAVASRLTAADRFALVSYGSSVSKELDWTDGDDGEIQEAIGSLDEGGSTNMEAGLKLAYELAEEELGNGAMRLELAPAVAEELQGEVNIRLSYREHGTGQMVEQTLNASYDGQPLDERGVYMPQPGIEKSVALALLVDDADPDCQ
jgi:hypothetical protein